MKRYKDRKRKDEKKKRRKERKGKGKEKEKDKRKKKNAQKWDLLDFWGGFEGWYVCIYVGGWRREGGKERTGKEGNKG